MPPILGVFSNLVTAQVKVLLPCTIFLYLLFDLVVQGILGMEVVLSPIMPCKCTMVHYLVCIEPVDCVA